MKSTKSTMNRALITVASLAMLAMGGDTEATDLGYRGAELRAGIVLPSDYDSGIELGAAVDYGTLMSHLHLYPSVAYSRAESSQSIPFGFGVTARFDTEVTDLAIGAEARYFLDAEPRGFYFGGGPFVNLISVDLSASVDVDDQPVDTSSFTADEGTTFGITGVAGYRLDLGQRLGVFAEARYNTVSAIRGFSLLAGVSF